MRNSRLLILLVVLLVAGLSVAAWFVLDSDNRSTVRNTDDAIQALVDDPPPRPAQPSDSPRKNAGTVAKAPDVADTPKPDATSAPTHSAKTDDSASGEPQSKIAWSEPKYTEVTVTGTVRYRGDNRAAVGAVITAELSQVANMLWKSIPDAEKAAHMPVLSGQATTDGAGEFRLQLKITWHEADTPTGQSFEVVARMSGYAPARSQDIEFSEKEQHVELLLAVPAALSGRVIDSGTRQGVAEAAGTLWDTSMVGSGGGSRSFSTDSDGYFSVRDLPAATYSMWVSAEGYDPYNGWQSDGRIDLSKGGETNIGDIALTKNATVSGRVVNEKGEPVPGADCRMIAQGAAPWAATDPSAVSDAEGRFVLKNVQAGIHDLSVRSEAHGLGEAKGIKIEAAKEKDLGDIRLSAAATLTGRVVDSNGDGVTGAKVAITASRNDPSMMDLMPGRKIAEATTHADGTFEIRSMPDGDFAATVKAAGFALFEHAFKFPCSALTLTLNRGGALVGRVVDAAGVPQAGATVGLTSHSSPQYTWIKAAGQAVPWMGSGDLQAQTREDGRFTIKFIPTGVYLLGATTQSGQTATRDDLAFEEDKLIDIGDLKLEGKGTVRVVVTEGGQPAYGVRLSLNTMFAWGSGDHAATTDAAGIADIRDVAAGTWYIRTDREANTFDTEAMQKRKVTVKTGETVEFHLELKPTDGIRLHGRFTLNGAPKLTDVILVGRGGLEGVIKTGHCNEGYYEFVAVTPGSYNLYATPGDNRLGGMIPLELKEPGELEVSRDFRGFTLSGRVVTPESNTTQNAAVNMTLQRSGAEVDTYGAYLVGRTKCDAQGMFRFEGICAGAYNLVAMLDGVGNARVTVQVETGDRTDLTLSIDDNFGSILVRITKTNGTPVSGNGFCIPRVYDAAGQAVTLIDQNSGFFLVQQGATATLANLSPGAYRLELNASGYMPESRGDVQVEKGKTKEIELELTACAELHATCTNSEITQAMLDKATVRLLNAQGQQVSAISSPFDAWIPGAQPEKPTLKVSYLGPTVTELRIKLAGYAEVTVPVEFAAGKKITADLTYVPE